MKRMPRILARLWLAMLLPVWLCASAAQADEAPTWLWKIEAPERPPSYLFGTIHIDDPRVTDFSPELRQALDAAQVFVMEVVPDYDLRYTLSKQGPLSGKLTPAELEQIGQLADLHAIPTDFALRMKPWLLASILSLPEARSPFTQDNVLYALAAGGRKRVVGLESPEAHFNALDSVSESDQIALLRATLAKSPQQKEADFNQVVDAYLRREHQAMLAGDVQRMDGITPEAGKRMIELLLDKRNIAMAAGIRREMARAPVFVAVGASHLPGEQGLIALLRKAGFTVSGIAESRMR